MKSDEIVKIHELSIEELRRTYDEICEHYSSARNRILTFFAGSLGFLGFLYGDGINDAGLNNIFLPTELYGVIFYWMGLSAYLIAIGVLIIAIQPIPWIIPTDFKEHKNLRYSSFATFQEYVIDEYIQAITFNQANEEKKKRLFNIAFYLLTFGAIVLVVIKNFSKT